MLPSQDQIDIMTKCLVKIKNKELVTKQDITGLLVPTSQDHYETYKKWNNDFYVSVNAAKEKHYAGSFVLDFSLNSIALNNWDRTQLRKKEAGSYSRSASGIVCTAKHKVIYDLLELKPIFMEWSDQVKYKNYFEDLRKSILGKGYFGGQNNIAIELLACK